MCKPGCLQLDLWHEACHSVYEWGRVVWPAWTSILAEGPGGHRAERNIAVWPGLVTHFGSTHPTPQIVGLAREDEEVDVEEQEQEQEQKLVLVLEQEPGQFVVEFDSCYLASDKVNEKQATDVDDNTGWWKDAAGPGNTGGHAGAH